MVSETKKFAMIDSNENNQKNEKTATINLSR
jgi:hypothetical protein